MYQIARITSLRCQIRDGIIGESASVLPMTYFSRELAWKLADRMSAADDDDEAGYRVFRVGDSPFMRPFPSTWGFAETSYDLPF